VIPRIFHQIWVGPNPFPEEFRVYQESWLTHHPDWQLRFWTEENLPIDLRRPEVLERLRVPAERSDILRLEALWREGGVYLDTDFECRRSIEPLIAGADFFAAYLKPGRVNNAVIGAVPGHPILDRALAELAPRTKHGYDKEAAGPLYLDRLLKDYPEVLIFPPAVFYPATPAERDRAVAVHHAARSWKGPAGFRAATEKAQARVAQAELELRRVRGERDKLRRRLAAVSSGAPDISSRWSRERVRGAVAAVPGARAAASRAWLLRPERLAASARARLEPLEPLVEAVRDASTRARTAVARRRTPLGPELELPRVLHLVNLDHAEQAAVFARRRRSWARLHPHWEIRVWSECNLPSGMRPEVYEPLRAPGERSHAVRLEVLHRWGGVAVDERLDPLRELDPALVGAELVGIDGGGEIVPALLAAVANHPVIGRALARLQFVEYHGQSPPSLALSPADFQEEKRRLLPRAAIDPRTSGEHEAALARDPACVHDDAARVETLAIEVRLDQLRRQVEAAERERAALEAELAQTV
jgi:inositol phosphorylceramide mannosyltransferase catalytic subunit